MRPPRPPLCPFGRLLEARIHTRRPAPESLAAQAAVELLRVLGELGPEDRGHVVRARAAARDALEAMPPELRQAAAQWGLRVDIAPERREPTLWADGRPGQPPERD